MNIQQQSASFLKTIQSRRRDPVSTNTVRLYTSYLDNWIVPTLGSMPVQDVENGQAKLLVGKLAEADLAPATIQGVLAVLKQVVSSAVDQNGNELYPRKWNHDFIDLPIVRKQDQDAPVLAGNAIWEAISRADRQGQALYLLLAATGLRIGEALALKSSAEPNGSWIDWQAKVVHVNSTLVGGKVQAGPKSDAGIRQVDLSGEVCDYLFERLGKVEGFLFQSATGGCMRLRTAYDQLKAAGIGEGFHAFRRFRITHLDSVGIPRGYVAFWAGHAAQSVTDGYIKVDSNFAGRREQVERAGLGFQLEA